MRRLALLLATAALLTSSVAEAQSAGVELTIFAGYRSGGSFNPVDSFDEIFEPRLEVEDGDVLGAALGIPLTNNLAIELLYSQQDTELFVDAGLFRPQDKISDLDVTYAHAGLQYQWTPGQLRPFVGFGLGLARLDPKGTDLDTEAAFSGNVNGGVKVFISDHLGIRLDGRVYFADLERFRGDHCSFCDDYQDDDLYQAEANVGVIFKF